MKSKLTVIHFNPCNPAPFFFYKLLLLFCPIESFLSNSVIYLVANGDITWKLSKPNSFFFRRDSAALIATKWELSRKMSEGCPEYHSSMGVVPSRYIFFYYCYNVNSVV